MNWYALSVAVNFEKAAKLAIEERIADSELSTAFGEILIPAERVVDIKKTGKQVSERKLYPGYIFVEMEMASAGWEARWHLVRRTKRVKGFVPDATTVKDRDGVEKMIPPAPLPDGEVAKIRRLVVDSEQKQPVFRSLFSVGDQIRIKEGPFADFAGAVETVNVERSRLTVLVMVFGRSTPVELGFEQVDKM